MPHYTSLSHQLFSNMIFWVNQVGTLFRDGGEGAAVYDLHQTFAFLHVPASVEKNSVLDCSCENGYWN